MNAASDDESSPPPVSQRYRVAMISLVVLTALFALGALFWSARFERVFNDMLSPGERLPKLARFVFAWRWLLAAGSAAVAAGGIAAVATRRSVSATTNVAVTATLLLGACGAVVTVAVMLPLNQIIRQMAP